MSTLLPVGSIVSVDKDKDIELMITGYYPINTETNEIYEYTGTSYPSGVVREGKYFLFNNRDIRKIIFEGYSTEQSRKALAELAKSTDELIAEKTGQHPEKQDQGDLFF